MIDKCKPGVKYAESLCVFMQESYTGIVKHQMVDWSGGSRKQLGIMVAIKKGKEKHLLNYCPFCGGELLNADMFGGQE